MKYATTLTAFFFLSLMMAQEAISFRYLVPLPVTKHVSTRNWSYRLELLPEEKGAYALTVTQNDVRGERLDRDELTMASGSLFVWDSPVDAVNNRVRSLEITASVPMRGLLWMWNESHGQLNAVTVLAPIANSLVVPYLPDAGALSTSFTLQGRSDAVTDSHIVFDYFNTDRIAGAATVVRQDLPEFGHLTLTPGSNLLLGSIEQGDQAAWGRISASDEGFLISGFQTITDEAVFGNPDFSQTSALEMVPSGRSDGWVTFAAGPLVPDHRALFRDRFVLTNDLPNSVSVAFDLHTLVDVIDEASGETTTTVAIHREQIDLLPFQQLTPVLGEDLFNEYPGAPIRLHFSATQVLEETVAAAPIHVLRFQEGRDLPMAGSHFFSSAGNEMRAWLVLNSPFSSRLDITSLSQILTLPPQEEGDEPIVIHETSQIQVQLFDAERLLFSQNFTLGPGTVNSLFTTKRIADLMAEKFPEETIELVRVHVSVIDGRPITGTLVSEWENDIALVNPRIFTRTLVEPLPEDGAVK